MSKMLTPISPSSSIYQERLGSVLHDAINAALMNRADPKKEAEKAAEAFAAGLAAFKAATSSYPADSPSAPSEAP